MYCTPTEALRARKVHRCDSCGEVIEVGQQYNRWRCYDGGDAGTSKMHPECYDMHQHDARVLGDGEWTYERYGHGRPTPTAT